MQNDADLCKCCTPPNKTLHIHNRPPTHAYTMNNYKSCCSIFVRCSEELPISSKITDKESRLVNTLAEQMSVIMKDYFNNCFKLVEYEESIQSKAIYYNDKGGCLWCSSVVAIYEANKLTMLNKYNSKIDYLAKSLYKEIDKFAWPDSRIGYSGLSAKLDISTISQYAPSLTNINRCVYGVLIRDLIDLLQQVMKELRYYLYNTLTNAKKYILEHLTKYSDIISRELVNQYRSGQSTAILTFPIKVLEMEGIRYGYVHPIANYFSLLLFNRISEFDAQLTNRLRRQTSIASILLKYHDPSDELIKRGYEKLISYCETIIKYATKLQIKIDHQCAIFEYLEPLSCYFYESIQRMITLSYNHDYVNIRYAVIKAMRDLEACNSFDIL